MGGRIESSDQSISDVFSKFYIVPDFQREYVWKQRNVEQLLQDSLDVLQREGIGFGGEEEYFIGSIVVCPAGESQYQVIDGQQRLTTCFLLQCVVRDMIVEKGDNLPKSLQSMIADSIMGADGNDVDLYRLVLQYEDARDALDRIADINGPDIVEIVGDTSSIRHLLSAYETIRKFLTENFGADTGQIKEFISSFNRRVKLIRVITPDISMALKVFETINDRGVGLNAMDLLKNLLFMSARADEFSDLKKSWKELSDALDEIGEKPLRFMRYFVLANFDTNTQKTSQQQKDPKTQKPIREDELYQWLSSNEEVTRIKQDPLAFVELLKENVHAYRNFIEGNDPRGKTNRFLRNMKAANGQQRLHFVLLLAGRHLGESDFNYLSKNVEDIIFCFNITRTRTNYLESKLTLWSAIIREAETKADLESLIAQFQKEKADRSHVFDRVFESLSIRDVQQYRLKYILAKFAQHLNAMAYGSGDDQRLEKYLDSRVHIEHILPNSPSPVLLDSFDLPEQYDQYKAMLGNLTLLESSINTSIGNGDVAEKRNGYSSSNFILTKSVFDAPGFGVNTKIHKAFSLMPHADQWTSGAIVKRQDAMRKLAREIWDVQSY